MKDMLACWRVSALARWKRTVKPRAARRRGFVLITLYLLLSVLVAFSGALVAHALGDARDARRSQISLQTLYLAEAGLDQAIASLRDAAFVAQVSDAAADPEIPYTALGAGGFEVDIDPVPGQPNLYRIQAFGYSPSQQVAAPDFQRRLVDAFVQVQSGVAYPNGIFGIEEVELYGSVRVDSYDSSQANFMSTRRGLVGSNGTASGTIEVVGALEVFGDVLAGPGAQPDAIEIRGSSWVSGEVGAAEEAVVLPPVTEPAGTEDLKITNTQEVYPGGTYRWDELEITGNGSLTFTGPAKVYVRELEVRGTALGTADNLPANLLIHVVGDGEVEMRGNSAFYGVIYAPEAEVDLKGNNRLFGAVVGREVEVKGSVEVWYDEALQDLGGSSANQVSVMTWREVN